MATAESVKAKLIGLIDASNAATGAADTDITAAINNLISGFVGGGVDIKSMKVTPTEVVQAVTLPALIGKQNVILIPRFAPAADMTISGRITGLFLYFQGAFYASTRTLSSNAGWAAMATNEPYGSTKINYSTFHPETGRIGGGGGINGNLVCQEYEIFYW